MSNYKTLASFIIPCTVDQAATAIHSLVHITDQFTDYADLAVFKADSEDLSPEEHIIRHCFYNHPEQEEDNSLKELSWEFAVEPTGEGLWVHADESINIEHAAVFTQAVLKAFELPSLVVIEAADICSDPRPDAFGGHACVVTKNKIAWANFDLFIGSEKRAHENGFRYFICKITVESDGVEHDDRFLMQCSQTENPEEKIKSIYTFYREGGVIDDYGKIEYSCGTLGIGYELKPITASEFEVIKNYLSVQ